MILDFAKALSALRGTTRAVLTPSEAAKVLSVSQTHIGNLIEEGALGALDLSGPKASRRCLRIPIKELIRFVEERSSLAEPTKK